jgi:hypothetical protein
MCQFINIMEKFLNTYIYRYSRILMFLFFVYLIVTYGVINKIQFDDRIRILMMTSILFVIVETYYPDINHKNLNSNKKTYNKI